MSGAARACLDLGLHRLPNHADSPDIIFKNTVFWYIYSWDKGLAITCGRTPVIHQYDVTSNFRPCLFDETTVHGRYAVRCSLDSNRGIEWCSVGS